MVLREFQFLIGRLQTPFWVDISGLSIACGVGDIGTQANRIPERLVDKRFGDFARCRRSPGVFALLEVDDKNATCAIHYTKPL